MFCTYCQQKRIENETPCPHCGAPSPLLQLSGIGQWGTNNSAGTWTGNKSGLSYNLQTNSWGGPATNETSLQARGGQGGQASPNQSIQQLSPSFLQPMPMEAPAPSSFNGNWTQTFSGAANPNMPDQQDNGGERPETSKALVPMVYQDPQMNDPRQSTVALQLISEHTIQQLLPEISEVSEGVYVAPLYTKPRPIIPKYRIISGTLSVLIVALMLCGGIGYYAKVSGTLDRVVRQFTGAGPTQSTNQTNIALANPSSKPDLGPAANIIYSGTTTLHIDKNNVAAETDQVFTVNQPFYVTYTVQPPVGKDGRVTVKWYMDGQFYLPVTSDLIKGGTTKNGSLQMQYAKPAQGSVEIYWNNDLAERFYFVVRPAPNN